jgi:tetratricopeptide (TPR) repeat protein
MAESKFYKVVVILKDSKTDANRYKFALSCMKISKFKEGEKALLGAEAVKSDKDYSAIPNGSYGLYLLGCITEKDHRYTEAKAYYQKALEINPTLWCAYEKLGKLGENTLPSKVFTDTKMKGHETAKRPGNTPVVTRRSAK